MMGSLEGGGNDSVRWFTAGVISLLFCLGIRLRPQVSFGVPFLFLSWAGHDFILRRQQDDTHQRSERLSLCFDLFFFSFVGSKR